MNSAQSEELDELQEAAVQRALTLDGFGLFFQPRVGKTRTALAIVRRRLDVDFLLIVAPKNILHVWEKAIADGGVRAGVITKISHYEAMPNRKIRRHLRETLKQYRAPMVILDEAHRIKKRSSKQSKACRTLTACSKYRLALTGTPIAQGLQDAWAIFNFLDPSVFGPWDHFAGRFLELDGRFRSKVIGYRNLDEFNEILHAHCDFIELGVVAKRKIQVRRRILTIPMSARLYQHYHELDKTLKTQFKRVKVEAPLVITLALRLQQMAGGFISDGKQTSQIDNSKAVAVMKLIEDEPVVICARYLPEIELIETLCRLKGLTVRLVRGGMPLDTPFIEDVCVIQVQCGIGIDLSRANHVIFYSWDHSFINYEQMRFRILSREKTSAKYTFLMMDNSIDLPIYEAFTKKRKLADTIREYYRRLR